MIGRSIQGLLALVGLGAVVYVFFTVRLVEHTPFEHVQRIWATEPAQAFQREAEQAGQQAVAEVREQLVEGAASSLVPGSSATESD